MTGSNGDKPARGYRFCIRTPEAAGEAATLSDAVVGSAVVDIIANNLSDDGSTHDEIKKIAAFVGDLQKVSPPASVRETGDAA